MSSKLFHPKVGRRVQGAFAMADSTSERINPGTAGATVEGGSSPTEPAIDHIRDALRGLRFGTVSIVVQDGLVVQIDRTEKRRLR
jgi:hypothetical protein